jgi:hypothetical protein
LCFLSHSSAISGRGQSHAGKLAKVCGEKCSKRAKRRFEYFPGTNPGQCTPTGRFHGGNTLKSVKIRTRSVLPGNPTRGKENRYTLGKWTLTGILAITEIPREASPRSGTSVYSRPRNIGTSNTPTSGNSTDNFLGSGMSNIRDVPRASGELSRTGRERCRRSSTQLPV